MSKLIYGRGYVYSIKYYIAWCIKYRHKVLVDKTDDKLKEIIKGIVNYNNFIMEEQKE